MVLAGPGTGKTFGAILAMLNATEKSLFRPQALFLCATYDNAVQVAAKTCEMVLNGQLNVEVALFTGDTYHMFHPHRDIIIGTPNHVAEAITEYQIKVQNIKTIYFDDGDFTMASKRVLDEIINRTSARLVYLSNVAQEHVIDRMRSRPVLYCPLTIGIHTQVNPHILHYALVCSAADKLKSVKELCNLTNEENKAIIFCDVSILVYIWPIQ